LVMQMPPGKHLRIPWLLASPQDDEHGYTQARLGACRPGSTDPVGLCGCGWRSLIAKIHSPQSSGARRIQQKPTNGRGASGRGSCGSRRRTSRIRSRWTSSYAGRAASTLAQAGSPGAGGGVLRVEPQGKPWAGGSSRQSMADGRPAMCYPPAGRRAKPERRGPCRSESAHRRSGRRSPRGSTP
jgi:hypothetical protein